MSEELISLQKFELQKIDAPGNGLPLKVAFWTLGCRLNQYDTESIKTAMSHLYTVEVVSWKEAAHLYVLNSCTVTSKADQECRRLARQIKRRNPGSKVVVVGCYAQTQPEALSAVDEIDGVIGNTAKDRVQDWLPSLFDKVEPLVDVQNFTAEPQFEAPLVETFAGRSRAFVKIQDGCDLRCTYCLIWQARGPGRSRSQEDVLQQLQILVDNGYPETILAGIHLGAYGRDLTPRIELPNFLQTCLTQFPELRIRLSSIHPNEINPELLALFADNAHMRPHLHISLQSGCDGVLKRMKRPYKSDLAWKAISDVAATKPHFGIGADIIVGFPGETSEEFEETRKMIAELPFSYLHVFRFSPRPGTIAANMPDQVHPEEITWRGAELRKLAQQKHEEFSRAMIGLTTEAVIEAESKIPGWRLATTDNYLTTMVPDGLTAGTLARVRIDKFEDDNLFGEVTEVISHGRDPESKESKEAGE